MLGIVAALFVLGRLMHGYAFSFTDKWVLGRVGGTGLTLIGLMLLPLVALAAAFG